MEAPDVVEAQVAAHPYQQVLDGADIGHGVGHAAAPLARQVQQRVADQLPRTVEGDVAAPVGTLQVRAHLVGRCQQVSGAGPHTERVDGVVLEQEQVVVGAVLVDALLQRQRVAVADPSQPADPEGPRRHRWGRGGHNSVSQSRVSITWRTRPRNAAA